MTKKVLAININYIYIKGNALILLPKTIYFDIQV